MTMKIAGIDLSIFWDWDLERCCDAVLAHNWVEEMQGIEGGQIRKSRVHEKGILNRYIKYCRMIKGGQVVRLRY
jgi:hypothetical protein